MKFANNFTWIIKLNATKTKSTFVHILNHSSINKIILIILTNDSILMTTKPTELLHPLSIWTLSINFAPSL